MEIMLAELPEPLKILQMKARKFIQEEILPLEKEIDYEAVELPREHYERLCQKAKEEGLWCPMAPKKYGGGGLNTFEMCVVHEERVQHRHGLYGAGYGTFGREPPAILYQGNQYQIENYVIPTIEGKKRAFMAITEPSGGSDPAGAIQTTAVKQGNNWVINGVKSQITGADVSDYGLVYVRTDPDKGRAGISCFIVDTNTPGLEIKPQYCIRPFYPCMMVFKDVVVSDEHLVGEPGQGFMLGNLQLTRNRFSYSAANLGVAVAAHRMALDYCKKRATFGELLSQRQAIQWMLVDSEIEIRACRALIWAGASKADCSENVRDFQQEAAIAKLYSSEILGHVVDRAVQIHGSLGVMKDLPLERWYREARIRRIGEGPSEVQRMVIARNLLRD